MTTLIANHRADLRIPSIHVVFTVPPWLKFKLPELRDVRLLYNVKLWNNNANQARNRLDWNSAQVSLEEAYTLQSGWPRPRC